MRPDASVDFILLERYFAGECTLAEQQRVAAWLASDPRHRADAESYRRVVEGVLASRPADVSADAAWLRMNTRVSSEVRSREGGALSRRWPRRVGDRQHTGQWIPRVGYAAAGLIIGVALVVGRTMADRSSTQLVRDFTTPIGGRATVTLRDGTRLVLGPATHLRVPAGFGRANRTVALEGEALFTVVHDERHPFTVQSRRGVVRDVGTTFVVRDYADDAADRVAVAEGRVTLATGAGHRADLTVGDVATLANGSLSIAHHADLATELAWTQGGLAFRDTPFRTVVRELARTFDLEIVVADSALLSQVVTASFGDESADEVLAAVVLPIGGQVHRAGRHVVIRRAATGAGHAAPMAPSAGTVLTTARVGGPHE